MKDKIKKATAWIKDHEETIISGSVIAVYVAACVGAVVVSVKVYNAQVEQEAKVHESLQEAAKRGASVLPGPEGTWWILENQNG